EVISWGRQLGIRNLGFFMIGIPGETMRTARNTIALSRSLGLDYIQITRVTPFPNTELYRMLIESGFGDYWREFTKDSSAERSLPLVGTDLTSEEAMRLIAQAYRAFYFRPQYIFRALKRTRSILELKNSVEAALGLLVTS
ncbi:MAG: hypothetical protein KKC84_05990, partial [Candidatus Omnitrophica bacterium]|nr:hypothetical protein [Candidatus Omnitrophota bacterium]